MAVSKLKDGRWVVYYRDWRPDGKPYLKREYFGRGYQAETEARKRHNALNLFNRRRGKLHPTVNFGNKLSSAKKTKLRNTQDFYALFEKMRAQDTGRTVEFEVHTPMGFIDVMYPDEIVEIKPVAVWHHGYGQLVAYGAVNPGKKLRLFLFGDLSIGKLQRIKKHCFDARISLTFCGDISNEQGQWLNRRYIKNKCCETIFLGSEDRPA